MFSLIKKVFAVADDTFKNPPSPGFVINPPKALKDVPNLCVLLDNITRFLQIVVIPLAGLMIIWAAFQILTASGDPAKFATGKKTIVYALIGLGVVILAGEIVDIITGLLGADTDSLLCPK